MISDTGMKLARFLDLVRCPQCKKGRLSWESRSALVCAACQTHFPLIGGNPVLLRRDNNVFSPESYLNENTGSSQNNKRFSFIPSASVNLARRRVLKELKLRLDSLEKTSHVLVIGGGTQRVWLDELLGADDHFRQIIYSDIDSRADVDLFCDGHELPFLDGVIDAVVTTAVLEHVLYPDRVAAEIKRVLKPRGFLYSELPFMQQVHEGAYDFTRYSLSGHRRLFNNFHEIESGMVAGPATALVWSIENLALAFLNTRTTRALAKAFLRLTFGWIKYLDHFLVNRPEAMDGASCTYFFGMSSDTQASDADIIGRYVGGKHLTHI